MEKEAWGEGSQDIEEGRSGLGSHGQRGPGEASGERRGGAERGRGRGAEEASSNEAAFKSAKDWNEG